MADHLAEYNRPINFDLGAAGAAQWPLITKRVRKATKKSVFLKKQVFSARTVAPQGVCDEDLLFFSGAIQVLDEVGSIVDEIRAEQDPPTYSITDQRGRAPES